MENPKSKLVIVFKDGNEEKLNVYAPSQAERYVKNHPNKEEMAGATWYDSEGGAKELYKEKAAEKKATKKKK